MKPDNLKVLSMYGFRRIVFSPNRLLLMATACSYAACLAIACIYVREIQMVSSHLVPNDVCTSISDGIGDTANFSECIETFPEEKRVAHKSLNSEQSVIEEIGFFCEDFEPDRRTPKAAIKELIFSRTFWQFCLLSLLLLNVNWIISSDALQPTYLVRLEEFIMWASFSIGENIAWGRTFLHCIS